MYSAMAKCFAGDIAMEVTTDAVQVFGGYGYMVDYELERELRDALATTLCAMPDLARAAGDPSTPHPEMANSRAGSSLPA